MKLMHSEWQDRVKHWIRTLKDDFYEPLGEISWEAFTTMEYLTPQEAQEGDFAPVGPGFTWGREWEYAWFKGAITLPERAQGQRIVMDLKPDGESALFVNGKAFGTYRASWVYEPHHFMEDNVLSACGKKGEHFDLLMETYAGHFIPEAPTGGCATGPVLPGAYRDGAEEGKRRVLGKCTYGIWNEEAYQLYMDVSTLSMLLTTLEENSLRAARIAKALQQFTLIADFEQPREGRIASYKEAREALRPVMEAKNGSTAPVFYAVGNAHLDLAWLWPMAETYRKTERTFAAQLRLIEEYPEYKFIQSQPASYEMCKKYYPELFARIKEAIKGGQWIADGAMWVEPDTNMASGEALIRQLVHGKRYYKEEFGVDIRLEAEGTRLNFDTQIDWKELHRLLKACFPVNVYAENGINEIQFGYMERPAHRSRPYDKDRFEVCNHHYSAFCDGVHGAAVLNDSKYGISMNGNALELSLLRASACPEMQADNRVHHFTYGFTAWEGSFADSDVVRQGYELNVKPEIYAGALETFSAAEIDQANVILDTMKPAEDGSGDVILRLYESKKAAVTAKVRCALGSRAYLCDMLENVREEIPVENGEMTLAFGAFEVKTVRMKR